MTDHDRNTAIGDIQADPQLQLSHGRASGLQITIVTLACMFILGLMIYGLNQPVRENLTAGSPAPQTTGAAPAEPAAPRADPAQQPVPQQTKPGVTEDDSKR